MFLEDLWRHLNDKMVKAIEDTPTFKVFLIRFWLHNMAEYREYDDKEKSICIEEYIKTKIEKDPDWLNNLIANFTY